MHSHTKPFFKLIALTALLAIATGFMLPIEFILASATKSVTHFVSSLAPGVSVMSERAVNPVRAELTWAVQWAVFPIYLCVLFVAMPIRGKRLRQSIIEGTRKAPSMVKRRLLVVFAICFFGRQILSDIGVIESGSLLRCTLFVGDVADLSPRFRAPFTSNIGMVIHAWLIPVISAIFYWAISIFIANFFLYIKIPPPSSSVKNEV